LQAAHRLTVGWRSNASDMALYASQALPWSLQCTKPTKSPDRGTVMRCAAAFGL